VPNLGHDPLEDLFSAIRTILGRPHYKDEKDRFGKYLNLLLFWNRTHRITGVRTARDVVLKLFIDSLLFYPLLPSTRPLKLLDVGAGAGIPGVPLRIVDTGISLTLIEAKRKKASFLEMLKEEIGIKGTKVFQGRAEVIINQYTDLFEGFDAVVSRAVSSLEIIYPLAIPYLRPGGVLIISGPPRGKLALLQKGLLNANRQEVRISDLGVQRQFWVVRKDS
jgi:16S rRNA (guanine527-N7)-methyltransferase